MDNMKNNIPSHPTLAKSETKRNKETIKGDEHKTHNIVLAAAVLSFAHA